jgi:hypothetical protein
MTNATRLAQKAATDAQQIMAAVKNSYDNLPARRISCVISPALVTAQK